MKHAHINVRGTGIASASVQRSVTPTDMEHASQACLLCFSFLDFSHRFYTHTHTHTHTILLTLWLNECTEPALTNTPSCPAIAAFGVRFLFERKETERLVFVRVGRYCCRTENEGKWAPRSHQFYRKQRCTVCESFPMQCPTCFLLKRARRICLARRAQSGPPSSKLFITRSYLMILQKRWSGKYESLKINK